MFRSVVNKTSFDWRLIYDDAAPPPNTPPSMKHPHKHPSKRKETNNNSFKWNNKQNFKEKWFCTCVRKPERERSERITRQKKLGYTPILAWFRETRIAISYFLTRGSCIPKEKILLIFFEVKSRKWGSQYFRVNSGKCLQGIERESSEIYHEREYKWSKLNKSLGKYKPS